MFCPCPKPSIPLVLERHQRKAAKASRLAEAYEVVDRRDHGLCRATGAYTVPGAASATQRREHHHLMPRSRSRHQVTDPSNIITVRADAHQLITAKALLVEGVDAGQRIVFHWNREIVARGKEPFRLLSKRRSQNRTVGVTSQPKESSE